MQKKKKTHRYSYIPTRMAEEEKKKRMWRIWNPH
jgi:hypothetical protein